MLIVPRCSLSALLAAGCLLFGAASDCRAGCFCDWLFGRTTTYYAPQPVAVAPLPTTANYAPQAIPPATSYYAPQTPVAPPPTTSYYAPQTPPGAAPGYYAPQYYAPQPPVAPAVTAPRTSSYAPQTTYRAVAAGRVSPQLLYRVPTTTGYAPVNNAPVNNAPVNNAPVNNAPVNGYAPAASQPPAVAPATAYRPLTRGQAPTTSYRPVAAQAAASTVYRPVAAAPQTVYQPTLAYSPVTALQAPPRTVFGSACDGISPCRPYQSATVNYAPRTTYRTTWQRVPVTYFRPVSQIDPVTGAPVSVMQPCTTYRWQARRVYQPRLFAGTAPQAYAVAPAGQAVCEPTVAAPGFGSPTYATPDPMGAATPQFAPPSSVSPPPTGSAPADLPPRLQQSPPRTSVESGYRSLSPVREVEDEAARREQEAKQGEDDGQDGGKPKKQEETQSSLRFRPFAAPAAGSQHDPERGRMIPDHDRLAPPPAPRLLNPRDRTAELPVARGVASLASWPQPAAPQVKLAEPVRQEPSSPRPTRKRVEESGWKSVHRGRS